MLSEFRTRKMNALFKLHDFNGNGSLSRDDFEMMVRGGAMAAGLDPDEAVANDFGGGMGVWENVSARCDANADGRVTADEFVRGYAAWMEDRVAFEPVIQRNVTHFMNMMDLNNDGQVSRDEFIAKFNTGTAEMFDQLDSNGNGYITTDELLQHTMAFYYSEDPSEVGNYIVADIG